MGKEHINRFEKCVHCGEEHACVNAFALELFMENSDRQSEFVSQANHYINTELSKLADLQRRAAAWERVVERYNSVVPDGIIAPSEGVAIIYSFGEFVEDLVLAYNKEAADGRQ